MGIQNLTKFFREQIAPKPPEERAKDHEHRIRLATAAVLLETAYADSSFSLAEQSNIVSYLRERFELSEDDARELIESADEHRASAVDHFAVTNVLRRNTPLPERIEIVKEMWRLVYHDGHLHQYENYLVRKLADLLGLEHHVMIDAKMDVQKEIGG